MRHCVPFLSARVLALVMVGAAGAAACSGDLPAAPSSVPGSPVGVQAAAGSPGIYELTFYTSGLKPVVDYTLLVSQELILRAHVTDASGDPASGGTAIFEYCTRKGQFLPAAECERGRASWTHMITTEVDSAGYSFHVGFGACSKPRTIGFRFRYVSGGSGVARGGSPALDISWVAPSA